MISSVTRRQKKAMLPAFFALERNTNYTDVGYPLNVVSSLKGRYMFLNFLHQQEEIVTHKFAPGYEIK